MLYVVIPSVPSTTKAIEMIPAFVGTDAARIAWAYLVVFVVEIRTG